MFPSAGDELTVKPGGLVVAGVAFVATRVFLIDAASMGDPSLGALAGFVPLGLGLATVVYGVDLAVSTHDRAYARTVATAFVLGGAGLAAVVWTATVAHLESVSPITVRVVASALIAGGAGGLLVGVQVARNRRQRRQLAQHTDQTILLNRLLRHEVLNALTAIHGHSDLLATGEGDERSRTAIATSVDRIHRTVEDVGFLVRTVEERAAALDSIDVGAIATGVAEETPDVEATVPRDVTVRADEHLETVVDQLLARAAAPTETGPITITVTGHETGVDLAVRAPGRWLDAAERQVLVEGLPEFDSPDVGYDVSIVRLLVSQYGGTIEVDAAASGTTVTVTLPRTATETTPARSPGVDTTDLGNATVAGLAGGVMMGLLIQALAGQLAVIGALYGVRSLLLGWPAHLFHSVVFATLFVTACSQTRLHRYATSLLHRIALGVGFGLVLWFVAAGVVMPLWLTAVNVPTPVPSLSPISLVGHVLWGATVGAVVSILPGSDATDHWWPGPFG